MKYRKWPGLKAAAKRLGVSYGHLRLCLLGESQSPRLVSRYQALTGETGKLMPVLPLPTTIKKHQNEN
jgi:hypothetical protein